MSEQISLAQMLYGDDENKEDCTQTKTKPESREERIARQMYSPKEEEDQPPNPFAAYAKNRRKQERKWKDAAIASFLRQLEAG